MPLTDLSNTVQRVTNSHRPFNNKNRNKGPQRAFSAHNKGKTLKYEYPEPEEMHLISEKDLQMQMRKNLEDENYYSSLLIKKDEDENPVESLEASFKKLMNKMEPNKDEQVTNNSSSKIDEENGLPEPEHMPIYSEKLADYYHYKDEIEYDIAHSDNEEPQISREKVFDDLFNKLDTKLNLDLLNSDYYSFFSDSESDSDIIP